MGIPFELFLVMIIGCALLLFYGFTRGSVAAFLAGAGLMFGIGAFIGSNGLVMFDGTLYSYSETIIKTISETFVIMSFGLIGFSMAVAVFGRDPAYS